MSTRRTPKTLAMALLAVLMLLPAVAAAADQTLLMATTTSTDNTGLLDYLAPKFTAETGVTLKWVATGTGKALKLGENCDVDVLMVHAPPAEKAYIEAGYGKDRREIMYNDFVIIGPAADAAGIRGMDVTTAMQTVAAQEAVFVSRGDNSGTHKKEKLLWQHAGLAIPEKDAWYVQTGQGMLASINIAVERGGYIMTDRGTYIKYADTRGGNPELVVLVEGDAILLNQYSVIAVDPANCPDADYALATRFAEWITAPAAQRAIGDFRLLGKQLFTPNAQ